MPPKGPSCFLLPTGPASPGIRSGVFTKRAFVRLNRDGRDANFVPKDALCWDGHIDANDFCRAALKEQSRQVEFRGRNIATDVLSRHVVGTLIIT
jgi:hypothetical protein